MDNVSKALIIAGGFFIGIMLISLFMYVFTNFKEFQRASDISRDIIAIDTFNSRFSDYIMSSSNEAGEYKYITGAQFYNLLGLAIDENSKMDSVYTISINGVSSIDKLKSFRSREFYYTKSFISEYIVSDIQYIDGAISNIVISDYDGNLVSIT